MYWYSVLPLKSADLLVIEAVPVTYERSGDGLHAARWLFRALTDLACDLARERVSAGVPGRRRILAMLEFCGGMVGHPVTLCDSP
jgi:hypothetical protein